MLIFGHPIPPFDMFTGNAMFVLISVQVEFYLMWSKYNAIIQICVPKYTQLL